MKKSLPEDKVVLEAKAEGTLIDVLQFACEELFPAIKRAGAGRCAISTWRLLLGILSKKNLY
jgi:hypothetical protein